MDGFTITSNKGVQIPVGVKIDGASLTRVANELRIFTETLQKKCNLKLTIDTSAAQNVISQIQTSMNLLQSASNIGAGGLSGRGGRSGVSSASHQDREINRIVERYTNVIDIAQRKLAQGFSVPGAQEAVDNLQRLLEQYRATGEGANALRVAASTLNAALSKEASIEKYSDVIDVAQRKLNQGFKIPTVQEAINNLRQLLEHYRATGEGANALKVASEQLSAALRNEAAAAKRVNSQTNTRRTENKSAEKQFDVSKLNAYNNALERMRLRLLDIGPGKTTKEFDEFRTALGEVAANGGKGFDTLSQKAIQAQHSIKALAEETSAAKTITSKYTDTWFAQQGTRLTSLSNGNNASLIANAQAKLGELEDLKSEFTGTSSQIETFNTKLREYEQLVARAGSERTLNRSLDDQATSIANLKSQYQAYMTQFGQNLQHNLPLMEKFQKFGEDLSTGGPSNELQRRWAELTAEAKRAGVEVQTVRQRMTHLFGQHFNTALIMLAIRGLRQALRQLWQDIKEVNEALVQTQIVTGLSGAALEAYTDKAYAAADKSKDKVTNILSEATAFGRLGYDSELSVQLAQLTSMYSKLGDVDTSDATDAITALMKAFDLKSADEIELALDKMIYVGNNFPISAAGLGEGLNNAASALSSAGNSLEQTLALLMAANATVQNPSKSSTAMRTITARIRNTKAELDELGEELDEKYNTVAKYREQLKGLTGVDILDSAGKEFRSTYDILSDLAGMWENLDSTTQAAVTTMLAGTKQQDIFASLMKNFPSAQEAMAGMGDADGLMDEKFKAVEDSLSGALSGLSNAWSKFSNTLVNSGDVVEAVRALTSLVDALSAVTNFTGGTGLVAIATTIGVMTHRAREFSKTWAQLSNTVSYVNVYGNAGDYASAAAALNGYSEAQQRAILRSSQLTRTQKQQIQSILASASGHQVLTSTLVEEAVVSEKVGLSEEKQAAIKSRLNAALAGTTALKDTDIITNLNLLVSEEQLSVKEAKLIAEQLGLRVALVNTTTAAGEQAVELRLLGNEYTSIGAKMKGAIGGFGNFITILIGLGITAYSFFKQQAQEAIADIDKTQQSLHSLVEDASGVISEYDSKLSSLQSYQDRIQSIDDALRDTAANRSSDAFKTAQIELKSVVEDLTTEFGLQASEVAELTRNLQDYYSIVADSIDRQKYNELIDSEHFSSTAATLALFGYTPKGQSTSPQYTIHSKSSLSNKVSDLANYGYEMQGGADVRTASQNEFYRYISNIFKDLPDGLSLSIPWATTNTKTTGSVWKPGEQTVTTTGDILINADGVSAEDTLQWLENLFDTYQRAGMSQQAAVVSSTIKDFKDSIGYDEAKEVYSQWLDGYLRFDSKVGSEYTLYKSLTKGAEAALLTGDAEKASLLSQQAGEALQAAIDNADNDFIRTELYKFLTGDMQLKIDLTAGLNFAPDGTSGSGTMFASDTAKPSNYDDKYKFTEQGTATSSTSKVGALDKDVEGFLKARTAFFDLFNGLISIPDRRNPAISGSIYRGMSGAQPGLHSILSGEHEDDDAWSLDVDKAKDAIDLINEYFGTSFDEITEKNFGQIKEMFEAADVDIYGAVQGNLEDVLQFVSDKVDEYGIDMGDIIDLDNGTINFDALNAALASIPDSADKAGASASAYLANELQRVAGMTFSLYDAGNGVIKVKASGGRLTNASTTTDSKKGGGGGGGKHSQISDDIENVERLIKLFKELLNYYDEGSEQWIARQRQIIDQYKAGVEIAMAEYDRLIKKGLKQTDEDVKKIVDTILEYQGDIFDESEKLWDAVRKNQIDSLKHTKDQIDATIELEKTHHDLLIAIRDERRELEDELKAARDAYSEVMTPEELDAMFSVEDYAELMDKLAGIEGDAMALYRDYKEQIAAVSEDETYMIEHITDEFKRQYDLKMKEYEIAKAELGVARAQQELENVKNEQTVMMLIGGRWQWVADPEKVLEAEQKLADAEQELADAQDEYDFQSLIHEMEAQSSAYQKQIDALEALTFSMDELAEQIHLFSDSVYKELLTYLSQIAQATFDKYAGDTAIPAFAEGGVIKRGGLAMVHSGEPIFSTADAERLWRFVHDLGDTPINVDGVIGSFAQKLVSSSPIENQTAHQTVIDNSINIPGGIHVNGETAQQLIALLKSVVAPYQP